MKVSQALALNELMDKATDALLAVSGYLDALCYDYLHPPHLLAMKDKADAASTLIWEIQQALLDGTVEPAPEEEEEE